jgi:hypothetical protein
MAWRQITEDVVVLTFPWRTLGIDFKRNVTLLRLSDGRLVIHSTAPFTDEDRATIRAFGKPASLVEATLMHDTFAKEGRAAFPDLPYLAPDGFPDVTGIATQLLDSVPEEWIGEIDVIPIAGTRKNEHAFFHRRSRTLIVADLFFSMPPETRGWPRFFARQFMRLPRLFGISAFFRLIIRDRVAFERSVKQLLELDFENLIVAHWEPFVGKAKPAVEQALADFGFADVTRSA